MWCVMSFEDKEEKMSTEMAGIGGRETVSLTHNTSLPRSTVAYIAPEAPAGIHVRDTHRYTDADVGCDPDVRMWD
jgi:hypothetical protein